jgi:hypothetical protein
MKTKLGINRLVPLKCLLTLKTRLRFLKREGPLNLNKNVHRNKRKP